MSYLDTQQTTENYQKAPPPPQQPNGPRKLKPEEVEYLAFEGGGGKGAAYLGAIWALENADVLPARPKGNTKATKGCEEPGGESSIRGISGASAGAITAFLLSIGYSAKELYVATVLQNRIVGLMDGPRTGLSRSVVRDRTQGQIEWQFDNAADVEARKKAIEEKVSSFKIWVAEVVLSVLGIDVEDLKRELPELHPVLATLLRDDQKHLEAYVLDLLYDRGLFPCFGIRDALGFLLWQKVLTLDVGPEWLHNQGFPSYSGDVCEHPRLIRPWPDDWLSLTYVDPEYADEEKKRFAWWSMIPDSSKSVIREISFEQLYGWTGVDLVLAGTNLSIGEARYFSKDTTPLFPVVEAVGLSMSIPFMFKPVYISFPVGGSTDPAPAHDDVSGLYVARELAGYGYYSAVENAPQRGLLLERKDELEALRRWQQADEEYRTARIRRSDLLYEGWWCDGGVQENFPIHAFNAHDTTAGAGAPEHRYPRQRTRLPLHPSVLGLKLDGPQQPSPLPTHHPPRELPEESVPQHLRRGTEVDLAPAAAGDLLGALLDAMLNPSTEGKLGAREELQVIAVPAARLDTYEVEPARERILEAIPLAFHAVSTYFPVSSQR
jgi:predicted acylesterase/phospholipase RssA